MGNYTNKKYYILKYYLSKRREKMQKHALSVIFIFIWAMASFFYFEMHSSEKLLLNYAKIGDTKNVKMLVKDGANINYQDNNGKTALILASEHNQLEVAKFLLYNGATKDLSDENGNTALILASKNGHDKTANMLISNYVNIYAKNIYGEDALKVAIKNGHVNMVSLLLSSYKLDS